MGLPRGFTLVLIIALVIGGTRYMNRNLKRINTNNDVGAWDSNTKDGQRITIVTSSATTGGAYFELHGYCTNKGEGFYPQKPCSPPMHSHDEQVEDFTALKGVVIFTLNGTTSQLELGKTLSIPPGVPHSYYAGGSEPIEVSVRMSPGTPDQRFFENMMGIARQNGGMGKTNPMQVLLLFTENGITITEVPPSLWKLAKFIVVPLAKAMGYSSLYPDYVTKEGPPVPVVAKVPEAEAPAAAEAAPAAEAGACTSESGSCAAEAEPVAAGEAEVLHEAVPVEDVEVA